MGQKVSPNGLRLGINRTWVSRWYAHKNYAELLHSDLKIREMVKREFPQAGISKIIIERMANKTSLTICSSRPGVIIGKRGADIESLKNKLSKRLGNEVQLNILEIRKAEIDAQLVAGRIAQEMQGRVNYKRAMKRAISSAMRMGAQGIRILCAGRLGGAEIARKEEYHEGRVPLHTLRADIDYGFETAYTAYGTCGVKVWIYNGEIMEHDPMAQDKRMRAGQTTRQ